MSRPRRFLTFFVSTDHKVIGLGYALGGLFFLLVGFGLVLLLRWQLAFPGRSMPVLGPLLGALLGDSRMPGGVMVPEFYNQLGAMHGTIMVFLGVVPLAVGGLGSFLVPLQLGAAGMALPRLHRTSWWLFLGGGLVMLGSFFAPGGAAQTGWTAYPPLATITPLWGQVLWLVGLLLVLASSAAGAITTLTTVVQLRAPGLSFFRLPFFVWSQLVTAVLLLLAAPPLMTAALLQLMDRLAGSSFFLPQGLAVSGRVLEVSGGGSPLLWQHLFWFLAHPEVYVLILPALGIAAEVIACHSRRPLWGYRSMVGAALFLGFVSFLVWAHHMFLTGMSTSLSAFFQITTMIVSVPSVVILTALVLSLWGGSIRFPTPMLFALAFLPMFGIGGLTGLPLGLAATDVHLHDTYYVVGHFHLIVAPGALFGLFAGIYHWFPKATGRRLSEGLGRLHFWPSLVFMNGVFLPMLVQGLAGVSRRLYDGGEIYAHAQPVLKLNELMTWSAWGLAVAQLPFLWNLVLALRRPRTAEANPWQATTLEWAAPSPPPPGNFPRPPAAWRGPYEYSVPGHERDFLPQFEANAPLPPEPAGPDSEPPSYDLEVRPDTGWTNGRLAVALFLAAEVMLFAAFFASYLLLRVGAPEGTWPDGSSVVNLLAGLLGVVALLAALAALGIAARRLHRGAGRSGRRWLGAGALLSLAFLAVRVQELQHLLAQDLLPRTDTFLACWYALAGLHGVHAAALALYGAWLWLRAGRQTSRGLALRAEGLAAVWLFLVVVGLGTFAAFYAL